MLGTVILNTSIQTQQIQHTLDTSNTVEYEIQPGQEVPQVTGQMRQVPKVRLQVHR